MKIVFYSRSRHLLQLHKVVLLSLKITKLNSIVFRCRAVGSRIFFEYSEKLVLEISELLKLGNLENLIAVVQH
jgi:hypothetical protein